MLVDAGFGPVDLEADLITVLKPEGELFDGGVFTNPVLSPAVPPDSTLIRTSYMAIHTDDECEKILEIAGKAGKKFGIL